jgi:hypothetical protein
MGPNRKSSPATTVVRSPGRVAELADAQDSGSCVRKDVGVQVPPRPRTHAGVPTELGTPTDRSRAERLSGHFRKEPWREPGRSWRIRVRSGRTPVRFPTTAPGVVQALVGPVRHASVESHVAVALGRIRALPIRAGKEQALAEFTPASGGMVTLCWPHDRGGLALTSVLTAMRPPGSESGLLSSNWVRPGPKFSRGSQGVCLVSSETRRSQH